MLLTYGQSANIPSKLNVFYNQAYEVLFERHDALKGGYKRDRLTHLDIQDFGRLFSAFCLQTYDKRQLEFTHTQALEYIEKSQQITGLTCKKVDYLNDLIQAVCLLVEEGLQLVFSHRSFQEYFTARFIADARPDIQEPLVKKYSRMAQIDSVLHLLYELRPDIVETYYIIPGLDQLFANLGVKKKIGKRHYAKYFKIMFFSIEPHDEGCALSLKQPAHIFNLTRFAFQHCSSLVDLPTIDKSSMLSNKDKLKKLVTGHCEKAGMKTIILKDYPQVDNLLADVGGIPSVYSMETLVGLDRIRSALKQKTIIEEKSLESILSKK
ncbi:MAG TPA: hypothetical protein DHW81_05635 [Nitrospiraceae bacterium]|nr:hypothetical protein [Nitrospiraceae bacterium]